jgi:hypothetical protein
MTENPAPILSAWSSFYVMTGSSAAGLTGLMFVVISLIRDAERARSQDGIATFSTPTVMHFAAALLVSATMVAPWHTLAYPDALAALLGFCGLCYLLHVMFRAKHLSTYRADLEDWTWYTVLPLVAYAAIFAGGIAVAYVTSKALFAVGGGVVLLIFIGIRNAWDVVTFLAIREP